MARPRLVALYTDFGTTDVYAGVLHGIIRTLAPDAGMVDLTHGIAPGDRYAGAFMVLSSVPFLPRGTIHLCVVDPGVGTDRRIVAVRAAGHTFVGPDNGVLAPVVEALGGATDLRYVTNERLMRRRRSSTFHGRDIMAPVVAHLVRGIDFAIVGDEAPELVPLPDFAPVVGESEASGRILHVDRFGNVVTNILPGELSGPRGEWVLDLGGRRVANWGTTYGDVAPGELVAYPGSVGFLEVAARNGSAAAELGVASGEPVVARRDRGEA
jgi:S-adenosylmethionine hydrolase